ncbi:MAG: polyprenyl synthetase family protein [Gammaproteobacteria bacterium]|tara:strand:+ start:6083 stop:6976 length:894 start_codon:yes stop_codon:yes gene_type:complete
MGQSNHLTKVVLNNHNFESILFERINNKINNISLKKDLIDDPINYSLSNPGKRVRPLLAYLTADAIDLDLMKVDGLAAAIEVMHTYSLVHDDLPCMDNDSLRRGKPTIHIQYNESTAVLTGDALQSLAIMLISEDKNLTSDEKILLVQSLCRTVGHNGMILGQYLDLQFENTSPMRDEIINMYQLKTSLLIEFSIISPLLISNKLNEDWRDLARLIGTSFQLIDDLIDVTQPTEIIGKTASKDIDSKKKTLPILEGVEASKELINDYKIKAFKKLDNLRLGDHPLKHYIENLFKRVH